MPLSYIVLCKIKTMKRIVILAMLCGLISTGYAQELNFGIKGGINYSYFGNDGSSTDGIGFHVGAIVNAGFSDAFNLRAELLVSDRALQNKSELTLLGVTTSYKSSVNPIYLTLPILYRYNAGDKLSFYAGPQFSFLLTNSIRTKSFVGGDEITNVKISGSDAKAFMRGFEFAVAAGAEFNVSDNLGLGLRYVRGLQSVTDNDNATDFYNGVQLSLIYNL